MNLKMLQTTTRAHAAAATAVASGHSIEDSALTGKRTICQTSMHTHSRTAVTKE